jgi:Na+-transporting methylmalonyl-CoA/oxaloacetate decarboxylase beta subunit
MAWIHGAACASAVPVSERIFSKKVQNHEATVAIYAVLYNFAGIHKTLRITSSMAAGLSDRVCSL